MDIDIEQMATYPMESDDWVMTVLIGGVAMLFSFLIIPMFIVSGYFVKTLRAGMEGATDPPTFDDWGSIFKEGFVAAVIGLIYQIPTIIVFFIFVGGSILAFLTGSEAGVGAGLAGLFGGLFLSWILSIVFSIIGLAGVANYAQERRFGAGFDFGLITDVITDSSYLMAWVYIVALQIVVGLIAGFLNIIPLLGGIIGVFLTFYGVIIAGWILGHGFAEAVGQNAASETYSGGEDRDRRDSTESY
ncbi:MAG: hypothetical protein ACI8VE_002360 [Natrialbaceae archaeon]|jgi:hypothetical protein